LLFLSIPSEQSRASKTNLFLPRFPPRLGFPSPSSSPPIFLPSKTMLESDLFVFPVEGNPLREPFSFPFSHLPSLFTPFSIPGTPSEHTPPSPYLVIRLFLRIIGPDARRMFPSKQVLTSRGLFSTFPKENSVPALPFSLIPPLVFSSNPTPNVLRLQVTGDLPPGHPKLGSALLVSTCPQRWDRVE